jgi:hypothetical protein
MRWVVFAVTMVALCAPARSANTELGTYWFQECERKTLACAAYFEGSDQAAFVLKQTVYCMPKSMNIAQQAELVVKDLTGHPEKLNKNFGVLVRSVLVAAFPCSSN